MATQNRPRVKNNPVFDPSELADLIHIPAVGTGVSSHLLRPVESLELSTVDKSPVVSMPTVDKLTTVPTSIQSENWVSEDGLFISPAKVRPIRFPQDALSHAEQKVYYLLWQGGSREGEESPTEAGRPRRVQAGYDALGRGTGFSKKTIQRNIEKLIEKGFVAIETPADIYRRTSTTYRVFPFVDVRRRQLEKQRSHVARIGPGVVYAHRASQ